MDGDERWLRRGGKEASPCQCRTSMPVVKDAKMISMAERKRRWQWCFQPKKPHKKKLNTDERDLDGKKPWFPRVNQLVGVKIYRKSKPQKKKRMGQDVKHQAANRRSNEGVLAAGLSENQRPKTSHPRGIGDDRSSRLEDDQGKSCWGMACCSSQIQASLSATVKGKAGCRWVAGWVMKWSLMVYVD